VKELYERALAINVEHEGSDGVDTSGSNENLGKFLIQLAETDLTPDERKEHLRLSVSYFTEAF
jgi:hypothetical protein